MRQLVLSETLTTGMDGVAVWASVGSRVTVAGSRGVAVEIGGT